jgi:pyruvate kinase
MPVAASVDELVERALSSAKQFAGLPTGARVVITAGRQTGATGGTSLIMVREIP